VNAAMLAAYAAELARIAGELARAAADGARDPSELLPIRDAAREGATSLRVVQDAVRRGDLAAYGGQRDRSIRRSDLERWVTDRRAPVASVERDQMGRVELRLARRRSTGNSRRGAA
jgi:hypothetical protein